MKAERGFLDIEALAPTRGTSMSCSKRFGSIAYGCEHVQRLLSQSSGTTQLSFKQYDMLQDVLRAKVTVAQTCRDESGRSITFLGSTYLCLQCPSISTAVERERHGRAKKHMFSVDSRSGCLYCQLCQDFIYDPNFEDGRLELGFPALSLGRKKRKFDDLYPSREDLTYIAYNSSTAPCRAVGLRGLYNMGQTCFMSVILQCLLRNPLLRNYYLADGHKSMECSKENCISCAMDEIFTQLYTTEKTDGYGAVTMLLRSWLCGQALAGYQQQDAHEYLQFLMDQLHDTNQRLATTESESCNCIIHRAFYEDPIMDLSLDLRIQRRNRNVDTQESKAEAIIQLDSCLKRFTSPEKLEAKDYVCHSECGGTQQPAIKQLSMKRLSPTLCIQLKRFKHSKTSAAKLEAKFRFPMHFDMSPYTSRHKYSKSKGSFKTSSCNYDLSSLIVHKGGMNSGHYVSYCREAGQWFLFDDSKITLATESQVLDADAYLLFYIVRALR